MANQEHLTLLKQSLLHDWNRWRTKHSEVQPDLSGANLSQLDFSRANLSCTNLSGANLSETFLSEANLREANLIQANLSETDLSDAYLIQADLIGANLTKAKLSNANLRKAHLREADLGGADLSHANLRKADLSYANLTGADLSSADLSYVNLLRAHLFGTDLTGADLSFANLTRADLTRADLAGADLTRADLAGADLTGAILVGTNFTNAILTGCRIYGIAAWKVELTGATQDSLVITPEYEPEITVDNLKIAQFIYLLLNNQEIRDVIDTIAKKVVLILGRFTSEPKAVLDALRDALRQHEYLPILFDFDKPASRDITETISTLAHLARFVIADITDAKSIPQELMVIVPTLPSVPVQPLILTSQHEYGMFEHFTRFHWVLPVYRYSDEASLLQSLKEYVIDTAERKAQELAKR